MDKKEVLKRIGARIVAIRKEKGLSQSDLARLTGKDRQSVHRIEKGLNNVTIYYLLELAEVLKVDVEEFVKR